MFVVARQKNFEFYITSRSLLHPDKNKKNINFPLFLRLPLSTVQQASLWTLFHGVKKVSFNLWKAYTQIGNSGHLVWKVRAKEQRLRTGTGNPLAKSASSRKSARVLASGFLVCFFFCGSQSKGYSARKLNRGWNRKDGGGEKKGDGSYKTFAPPPRPLSFSFSFSV